MSYEEVEVLDAQGDIEKIVVDTDSSGRKFQVIRIDLGEDTSEQPLSGVVPVSAASLPLPSGAATAANQSTANSHLSTIAGAVSGGQVQVEVVGGTTSGTEYTEGETDASISGQAILWEDASDTLRPVSAAKPLPVNPQVDKGSGVVSASTQRVVLATDVALPAGSNSIGIVELGASSAYAGRFQVTDGITIAQILNGGLAVTVKDEDGNPVAFSYPKEITVSPSVGTSAAAQYQSLHTTVMEFEDAANQVNGTGHILGARLVSRNNSFAGQILANIFSEPITGTTALSALSVSDTDAADWLGTLLFDFSRSNGSVSRVATASRIDLPFPYKCSDNQSSLFIILQLWSDDTPTFGASDLSLTLMVQPD